MLTDEDFLSQVTGRIEHHLKAFETFEKIRWQALAFLSGLAIVGLSVMVQTASSYEAKLGAMALVILVCLAGIAIQIRVAAIVASLWTRIRVLQETVNEHLLEKQDGSILRQAMTIPSLETFTNLGRKGVAVHLATSFVFASMAAIALSILIWYLGISGRLSVFFGVLFLTILTIAFSYWSSLIRRNLELKNPASKDE